MMQPKRIIISLLVVVLLTFCALTAFAGTEGETSFGMAVSAKVDAAIVGVDNTFGVQKDSVVEFSVTANDTNAPFSLMMLTVTYDPTALELTADGVKFPEAYAGVTSVTNNDVPGHFELNYIDCKGMGELASFSFTVKDAHGNTTVVVEAHVFAKDTYADVPVTLAGDTTTIGVHSYGEAKTVNPDCLNGGYTYRACTVENCDAMIVLERTNKLGHDESGAPATCTTDKVCVREGCGEVLEAKLGHDDTGAPATCTTDKVCARGCGEVLEAKLGHDDTGAPATCTTDKVCARGCGEVLEAKLDHKYGAWAVTTDPTVEATGLLTKTCERDATHTVTFELPKLSEENGYTYEIVTPEDCVTDGMGKFTYAKDTQTFTFDVVRVALGHDDTGAAATCTTDKVCARGCGVVLEAKLGHHFGEWVIEKEPTMSKTGLEVKTCCGCGLTETREIAKKSSTWLVVLIIVVVVLAGGGFAAYWFLIKNKKATAESDETTEEISTESTEEVTEAPAKEATDEKTEE